MKVYDEKDIYTPQQKQNEETILKKIEEIKSVIAGREASFLPFIMNNDDIDLNKLESVINEFIVYIEKRDEKYNLHLNEKKRKFFYDFIYCTLIYCVVTCNEADCVFESVLKLAINSKKSKKEEKSVFDILLEDMQNDFPEEWEKYEIILHYSGFNASFEELYDDFFESDIRHAINSFLDLRKISKYTSEGEYKEIMKILNVASRRLRML